jgi:hypothetical protein
MTRQPCAWPRSRSSALLGLFYAVLSCSLERPTPPDGFPENTSSGTSGGGFAGSAGGGGAAESGGTGGGGADAGGAGGGGAGGSSGGGGGAGGGGAGAGTGGAGGAATSCREPGPAGALTTRLPCLLSETGLYAPDMTTLADGVHPFSPNFKLWTDGAEKKRWVALPAGTKVDTSDMDYWSFPTGTKLWKEFTRDGVRVETRLLQKQASGAWYAVAYQWRPDQREADAAPNGVKNASGTPHDVPNSDDCLTCHSQMPDKALGFSAIQLSHPKLDPSSTLEWTLDTLIQDGLLTQPPAQALTMPGTALDRDFFGYLHVNCGHCHNPKGTANTQTGLDLWLKVSDLAGPVSSISVYREIFDEEIVWLDAEHPDAPKRIAPGAPEESAIYRRLVEKGQTWSMPPLGTEEVDPAGKKLLEDWIAQPR